MPQDRGLGHLEGAALLAQDQVSEAALLMPLSTQPYPPQGPHCIACQLLHLRFHCTQTFTRVLIQCTLLMQTVHWKTPVMLLSPLLAHHQCRSPEHDAFHMQPAQTWCLSGMHIGSCQGKSSNRVRWLIALLPGHKHMSDCDNTLVLWWQQPSKTAIGTASMPF